MPGRPETHYARSGEVHVTYQVAGEGPVDLVMTPGFISHLDLEWESVAYRRFIRQLATFARLIRYDKRGTGLSDPVADVPTLEQRVDDLGAVLEAAGSSQAVLLGYSEGGPTAIQFVVRGVGRTLGLVLYGTASMPPPDVAGRLRGAVRYWGQGGTLKLIAPSLLPSITQLETRAAFERASASPAMAASAASASSSSSGPWPPATTSVSASTRAPSTSPRSASGYATRSHDLRDTPGCAGVLPSGDGL